MQSILRILLVVLMGLPGAKSTRADDPSSDSAISPLSLIHTVNEASLTAPGSRDLVVVSYPGFYAHVFVDRLSFFTSFDKPAPYTDHALVEIAGEIRAKSSAEDISESSDADCILQKAFVFQAGSKLPSAVVVLMQNSERNLSGSPALGPLTSPPTRLTRVELVRHATAYSVMYKFEITDRQTLDHYYCQFDSGNDRLMPAIMRLALKR